MDKKLPRSLRKRPGPRALFIHIQKTAGSTLVDEAKRQFLEPQVSSHGDYLGGEVSDKHFMSGHFGIAYAEPFLKDRYSFTFLRDPVDRIISLYNFAKDRDPGQNALYALVARTDSFEGFLAETVERPRGHDDPEKIGLHEHVWNHMTWQLGWGWGAGKSVIDFEPQDLLERALTTLDRLDFVGFHAAYERDAREVYKRLRMKKRRKHSNPSVKHVRRSELNAAELEYLRLATSLDEELYRAAVEKSSQQGLRDSLRGLLPSWASR